MFPSALGLTFAVDGKSAGLVVTARWGRYLRRKRGEGAEVDDAEGTGAAPAGRPHWVWQRYPMEGTATLQPLAVGRIGPLVLDAEQPEVTLRGSVTDPHAGWCGSRELITPGYPIRRQ